MSKGKLNKHIITGLLVVTGLSATSMTYSKENQIYKWTDDQGVVHYGDIKPGNVESQVLRVKPGKTITSSGSPQDKAKKVDEAYAKKKAQLDEMAKKAQADSNKKGRCEQARSNLQVMNSNGRVRVNENGKLRYLTPEEFAKQKQEMQKIIKEACQ